VKQKIKINFLMFLFAVNALAILALTIKSIYAWATAMLFLTMFCILELRVRSSKDENEPE
jgi:hypothetical protein